MPSQTSQRQRFRAPRLFVCASLILTAFLSACGVDEPTDGALLRNTYCELVDWHITGLWVFNCPVAWVRVVNYNSVPVKDIKLKFVTYDLAGNPLDNGVFLMEGEVPPGGVKNFIEQYLGFVNLHSEKLSVQVVGVTRGP
jgi:hypothetical protein